MRLRLLLALWLLGRAAIAASAPAPGDEPAATPGAGQELPSLEELERAGYRIGRVRLEIGEVFGESDGRFVLFRLANRLHRTTRPRVIERMLLFQPGDPVSASRIAESERLLLSLRVELAHDLAPERQLLLGGDTGLRGYPLRYQQGDRLVLASIEQRLYNDHELLHLFRLGAAAFFDVGRACFADEENANGQQLGTLRDLGVGLRIGSSRSARAGMVHLDIAMPLDGPSDIAHVQWLVSTSETF